MQDELVLSVEEKKAIAALKRLEKIWPKTLWLYSASGTHPCDEEKRRWREGRYAKRRGGQQLFRCEDQD